MLLDVLKNLGLEILSFCNILMDKVGNFIRQDLRKDQIWPLELLGLGENKLTD